MDIARIAPRFTAFIRPKEGANVGLIHTPQGLILIDTSSSPADIQALFTALGARAEEVRLVINTHSHSDHTWGNQVFACPILAHRLCQKLMKSALRRYWSPAALQAYLSTLEKTDLKKAREMHQVLETLQIKLPDQVFESHLQGELGGVNYELVHLGGHTPDCSIVWLPEEKILYASDLVFQGRYPYIFDADIPLWIEALDHLLEFDAKAVIPGHGVICGATEIRTIRSYLQHTWELTREHIQLGHGLKKTLAGDEFPVFPGEKYDLLHQANIRYMFRKLAK